LHNQHTKEAALGSRPHYAIGVDIGGTNIKLALIDADGTIYERETAPTPRDLNDAQAIVGNIIACAQDFKSRVESAGYQVEGIGFAVPQFLEGNNWIQRQTNNMPALEGFAMYPPLHKVFGPSIAMTNDLNAFGIAEHMFGKGHKSKRMLLMAIGTGIGTCFITQELGLVHFSWGTTGDTGQIIVDPFGAADCTCGGRGCLEAYAAAPAIRRRALGEVRRGKETLLLEKFKQQGDLEAQDVFECAKESDPTAIDIMNQTGFYLGVALSSYLHIFNPDLILLGGGVAQAGELLIEPIRNTINRLASPYYLKLLHNIDIAELSMDGAAVGCATLILYPGKYIR
jgi:glucokinase